jgi:NhaP-type Na+/H+ or K+/H+ antiporter
MPNVNKAEQDCWCICLKQVFLTCTVIWSVIGACMALIYFILMISFVEGLSEDKKHVAVPTICVVIQCGLLVLGLFAGFYAKWLAVKADDDDDEFHMA